MSHRPHAASDIIPGSRWPARDGPGCAHVTEAAAGYVAFIFTDGAVAAREHVHHLRFRARFVAPYDARGVRNWFAMCITNLQSFHAFWDPAKRKPHARTTRRSIADAYVPSRGRGGAVPQEAIYVGTYSDPFNSESFLADLHDAIAASPARPAAAA